jgi:hypothetical protein
MYSSRQYSDGLFYQVGRRDVSPIIREILSLPRWSHGNSLGMLFDYEDGANTARIGTFEGGAPPSLEMAYRFNSMIPPVVFIDHTAPTLSAETVWFLARSHDSDGLVVSHAWDFGDGTTATGNRPVHTYSASGEFAISVTATDDDGLTSVAYHTAAVDALPPSVRMTQPADGQWVGGDPFQISVEASDDLFLQSVVLYGEDPIWGAWVELARDYRSPLIFNADLSGYRFGDHYIKAEATDGVDHTVRHLIRVVR